METSIVLEVFLSAILFICVSVASSISGSKYCVLNLVLGFSTNIYENFIPSTSVH
jgi:hypothetical protein